MNDSTKNPLTINRLAELLSSELTATGWKTVVEDDYPDFRLLFSSKKDGRSALEGSYVVPDSEETSNL